MTKILYITADGKPAGEPLALPPARSRRRLSAIMKQHSQMRTRPALAFVVRRKEFETPLEQNHRLRRLWSTTLIGKHDTVIVMYPPRGGGSSKGTQSSKGKGASIGLLVATVALAAIGQFWAIGAIAGALGTTTAIAGSIWAVGSAALLGGAAYFLSKNNKSKANKDEQNRPLYGVSGGGNLPRANDRIPVIYGRTWHNPDLSQPDYAIYEGDDQRLFKRLTIACGKYALKTVRVAGVVFWTSSSGYTAAFPNSQLEIINPGAASTLVPGAVASVEAVGTNTLPKAADFPQYAGPFDFGSGARQQTRIQIDYTVQGSFATIKEGGSNAKYDGKQYPANWGVRFEYAPVDLDGNIIGGWNTLHQDGAYVQTTQPKRVTVFVDIPLGRYTFRAQNTGDPDEATHTSGGFTATFTNPVVWEGLRAHYPETIVRPGITELAMSIRSGKALSITSFGEVEVEVQRILPVWYGEVGGWIEEETRKSAWAAADILRNGAYGAAAPDSQLELTTFQHYANNVGPYDTFDAVIRGPVSVYDAMTTALGTMRATPLRLGNAWTIVRDEQKAVRKHVVTRRQIISDTSNQVFTVDLSDGSADVIVEWFAGGDPRRMRSERVTIGSQSLTPRRISLTGVQSYEHAVHLAKYAAASAYYRREKRSVGMEFAGRLILPNDKALIDMWYFDSVLSCGVNYRVNNELRLVVDADLSGFLELPGEPEIVSLTGDDLSLDGEPIFFGSSVVQYAMFRARDGREWGPVGIKISSTEILLDADDVAQAETLSGISFDDLLARPGQADTSVMIGNYSTMAEAYLIRSIAFNGDNVTIEGVYDAPEVWTTLGEPIIAPPPPPSTGLENEASAIVSYIRAQPVQKNNALVMEWTLGRGRNVDIYVVQLSYDNWLTYEQVSKGPVTSGTYILREGAGVVYVRAFGITPSGIKGPVVQMQFQYAPAVIDLGNAVNGSLPIEAFTDNIEPVLLVDGLPDPTGWVKPKIVFNIQDEKQYRFVEGEGWKPVFDVSDIPNGSITETLIADDSISTPKLQANSVATDNLIAGSVTTAILASDSVVAGKIAAGAVSANKINVTKLDAISADLGSILAGALNINNRFMVAANGTVTISSAASGARFIITGSAAFVYDASNVMRVRMGVW